MKMSTVKLAAFKETETQGVGHYAESVYRKRNGELMRVRELTIEEAWLYMPKPLKSLIRFLGMLMGAVVIVLCAI